MYICIYIYVYVYIPCAVCLGPVTSAPDCMVLGEVVKPQPNIQMSAEGRNQPHTNDTTNRGNPKIRLSMSRLAL